jgi:hypothetical protein
MVEVGHKEKGKRKSKVRFESSVGLCPILRPRGAIRGDLKSTHSGDHGLGRGFLFHNSDMRGTYVFFTLVIVPPRAASLLAH